MGKLRHGIGVYEKGKWSAYIDGIITKEYQLWTNMLYRCFSSKYHNKKPTYIGCSVSENFKNFQYFAEWCQHQTGFGVNGYQLDKDIIVKGNKVYSEDTCAFIPQCINTFLVNSQKCRGAFPLGVTHRKAEGKYRVRTKFKGKEIFVGGYDNLQDAFQAYKLKKTFQARLLAEEHKDSLDIRVYNALLNFNIEITD